MEPRLHPRTNRSDHTNRGDDGAVLVEYAFAFPILMGVVVFGLFILWAAFVQVQAGQAAREGARYASVALAPTYRTHPSVSQVVQRVKDRVPDLDLTDADVAVTYPDCASPCAAPKANTPVVVTVTKHLPGFLHDIAITASSEGEVRAE